MSLPDLNTEQLRPELLRAVEEFKQQYPIPENSADSTGRTAPPRFTYYGPEIWEKAVCAVLSGKNLLLAGPKATGKNVLAENLAWLFGRPTWNVSFHINVDASYLVGTDTFDGDRVVFRPGPILQSAKAGGFCVLDEINMAKNEAMAVLHSALDYRRVLEVSGYERTKIHPATRFIGTMNYGYAGTRELNEALCSRFMVLQMPTISEEHLNRLLTREYPDISRSMCDQLIAIFYELDEKATGAEISSRAVDLRGLLDAVALMKLGLSPMEAMDMGITNKVFDVVEREIIHDVIAARIPDSWSESQSGLLKNALDFRKTIAGETAGTAEEKKALIPAKKNTPAKGKEREKRSTPTNRKNPDSWMSGR